jgi:hypothetical protein
MLLKFGAGDHGKRFSDRLMKQMPIIIALGVNLGIVPLLFVQLAFPQFFYSATVLMGWYWFGVIWLLIPAYYGVYVYAGGLSDDGAAMSPLRIATGWAAAACFLVIGFIFANAFSLMANVENWRELWSSTNVGGAALGTALNTSDPALWPRWPLMFSLALMTTAAWSVLDAAWFGSQTDGEYKAWVSAFAWKLYLGGVVAFAAVGSWYAFGTWPKEIRELMFQGPLLVLTLITATLPALPLLILFGKRVGGASAARAAALWIMVAQVAVLATNAVSRQVVQIAKLQDYLQGWGEATQWSPLVVFLLVFVLGAGIVAWMLVQAVRGDRTAATC